MKSPCILCQRLARNYGGNLCRPCWKKREREKLSEYRQKARTPLRVWLDEIMETLEEMKKTLSIEEKASGSS